MNRRDDEVAVRVQRLVKLLMPSLSQCTRLNGEGMEVARAYGEVMLSYGTTVGGDIKTLLLLEELKLRVLMKWSLRDEFTEGVF